jgi:hypothetical protein
MNKVKIEAFLSEPQTTADVRLSQLLVRFEVELGEKLQIAIFGEDNVLFDKYNLTRTPAVVIGEMIKIIGVCPSDESIFSALKELGI